MNPFQHPRFHSFEKVMHDLKHHGTVKSYHHHPNPHEGEKHYKEKIWDNHHSIIDQINKMQKNENK